MISTNNIYNKINMNVWGSLNQQCFEKSVNMAISVSVTDLINRNVYLPVNKPVVFVIQVPIELKLAKYYFSQIK